MKRICRHFSSSSSLGTVTQFITNVEANLHYLEIMDNELDPGVSEIFETTDSTDL